jgi:hypothetical protein
VSTRSRTSPRRGAIGGDDGLAFASRSALYGVSRLLAWLRPKILDEGGKIGEAQVIERVRLFAFMHYDSGHFDDEVIRLEAIENPFAPKVLPVCSE